ncbi:MAG: 4-hydroxyphenylacetate decarboxylase large subunit [Bacteroidales bacterium]
MSNQLPSARAAGLRDVYYMTLSSSDLEFPYWYNRKWKELEGEVTVVRRALALKEAFSRITPNIIPGELIVMQKTYNYRGSFPMPWLSEGFFLAKKKDLYKEADQAANLNADELSEFGNGGGNVTKSFGNIVSIAGKFGMRKEEIPVLLKISKDWEGKSVEDLSRKYEKKVPDFSFKDNIMQSLICMFDSGYTLPQGREVINYFYPLQFGFDNLIQMAKECMNDVAGKADGDGLLGMDRMYFYEAVINVIEGIQNWILNYAEHALDLYNSACDIKIKEEYNRTYEILKNIAHKPPVNFREALQLSYTLHIAALNEDAISGLAIGRLGQILYPWYKHDIEKGIITKDEVHELMELYRIKITNIDCFASMGVVGGVLSGNTFNNLTLGGITHDGQAANNELEEIILEAGITCKTPQPTLSVLYDEKLPEYFLLKAAECTKTGAGYPAWMNNRVGIDFIIDQYSEEGMTVSEARALAIGGCLETSPSCWKTLKLHGKEFFIPGGAGQPTSVGVHFISNPKILELVLTNGLDLRTNIQVFPPHNLIFTTYSEFVYQFKKYYEDACNILVKCNNIQHDIWRKKNMSVVNSFLKPDCLDLGLHIGNLGYRYNATFNVESCGTITMVNSLSAIKKLIFDEKKYSIELLVKAIESNFGYKNAAATGVYSSIALKENDQEQKWKEIHKDCLEAPKFGNDDSYVDQILKDYEEWFCKMTRKLESLYAKKMYACQISVSTHGPQGAATLASADGRLSGTTFSDGSMSAYPGTDLSGPYAVFNSATKWDHSKSQNSQLNMKLHPLALEGKKGTKSLLDLTRAYMRKGGFHIQYNIIDSKTLRIAQKSPENYRDLMVRVAGFTQYWCEIGKPIQDEVIARTEYNKV